MLQYFIANIPNSRSSGEILSPAHFERQGRYCPVAIEAYLEKEAYDKKCTIGGFKLLLCHIEKRKNFIKYLQKNTDIKIIWINRKNVLAQYVSQQKAFQLKMWTTFNYSYDNKKFRTQCDFQLTINANDFLEYISFLKKCEVDAVELLQGHEFLNVNYEDLCDDQEKELNRISDFLGITIPTNATTPTRKTGVRPLSYTVTNYNELKLNFTGTEYEQFFE